ncbi:MAG TPA: plastocyanin/azurin family copper-binding protein [Gemmatimonadaceae bacterium]|nr:plastocyanin/azurin family copper-binding protein [Gemmatimonadaceae bacterium]
MNRNRLLVVVGIAAAGVIAACGGGEKSDSPEASSSPAAAPVAGAPSSGPAATPTGKVIVVKLITDGAGNRFEPSELEAHRGDVIRYTLTTGVHNVHFLPDSNPGKTGLPPASDMLQLPGQTLDIPVNFAEGHYYFQCDPHAALGMIGHIEVED